MKPEIEWQYRHRLSRFGAGENMISEGGPVTWFHEDGTPVAYKKKSPDDGLSQHPEYATEMNPHPLLKELVQDVQSYRFDSHALTREVFEIFAERAENKLPFPRVQEFSGLFLELYLRDALNNAREKGFPISPIPHHLRSGEYFFSSSDAFNNVKASRFYRTDREGNPRGEVCAEYDAVGVLHIGHGQVMPFVFEVKASLDPTEVNGINDAMKPEAIEKKYRPLDLVFDGASLGYVLLALDGMHNAFSSWQRHFRENGGIIETVPLRHMQLVDASLRVKNKLSVLAPHE